MTRKDAWEDTATGLKYLGLLLLYLLPFLVTVSLAVFAGWLSDALHRLSRRAIKWSFAIEDRAKYDEGGEWLRRREERL